MPTLYRALCCPPMQELCAAELAELCDHVSTLGFDGTIADEASIDRWDVAFITPQAFTDAGGIKPLFALYDRLAQLVSAGRVG